jgi:regulator of protease activity HflC (stomatin/prohibitin superfamily)
MIEHEESVPPDLLDRLINAVIAFFYNLIEGDHEWADRRLLLLALGVLAFTVMGRFTENAAPWAPLQPALAPLPAPVRDSVNFAVSMIYPQTLRHALPPLVACVLAVLLASNYVRDLFELPDLTTGYRYLTASMFGWNYPGIKIKSGGYEVAEKSQPGQIEQAATNPIPKIGGPGYVEVAPGNVALFEHVGGPSKVAGAGKHFIRRFETLRDVLDLHDQFRTQEEVKALTKDGVPVKVKNVQVAFRLRTSNRQRTEEETYPFSVSAIKAIAYGKTVGPKGPSVWTNSAPGMVAGIIRNHLSRMTLDEITDKREGDPNSPREKIKQTFEHKDTRKRFASMGVDLLWVSLGHIETPEDVLDQRIRAWEAGWEGEARVTIAQGEAEKVRAMEIAKAKARLEIIEKITGGLPLSLDDSPDNRFVLIQFVEALSSFGQQQQRKSSTVALKSDDIEWLRRLGLTQNGETEPPSQYQPPPLLPT